MLFTARSIPYNRRPMSRYLIQLLNGSERTIQADRLELSPPIQTCRFHSGDSVEELPLETIRAVVLLDVGSGDDDSSHGGLEVHAETAGAVEISQPNVLQPGTMSAVFVPAAEVEWLVGELRRARAELPGARRQRPSTVLRREADTRGKKKTAKRQRASSPRAKKSAARRTR